jgi:hypothetical protein
MWASGPFAIIMNQLINGQVHQMSPWFLALVGCMAALGGSIEVNNGCAFCGFTHM